MTPKVLLFTISFQMFGTTGVEIKSRCHEQIPEQLSPGMCKANGLLTDRPTSMKSGHDTVYHNVGVPNISQNALNLRLLHLPV